MIRFPDQSQHRTSHCHTSRKSGHPDFITEVFQTADSLGSCCGTNSERRCSLSTSILFRRENSAPPWLRSRKSIRPAVDRDRGDFGALDRRDGSASCQRNFPIFKLRTDPFGDSKCLAGRVHSKQQLLGEVFAHAVNGRQLPAAFHCNHFDSYLAVFMCLLLTAPPRRRAFFFRLF